jgi:hypothetical protein
MKQIIIAIALFSLPVLVNAQEPVKENNSSKTPPSSGKAINEKGVSSVKTRGLTKKSTSKTEDSSKQDSAFVQPVQKTDEQDKPQADPKKDKKEPKKESGTQKSINEKGVSSPKTRGAKNQRKSAVTQTTTIEPKK